jgi:hypothetical protein
MKQVLISTIVSRWIEVPDDADDHDILYETDGIFQGIDGDLWDIKDCEIVDEETIE